MGSGKELTGYWERLRETRKLEFLAGSRTFREYVSRRAALVSQEVCSRLGVIGPRSLDYSGYAKRVAGFYLRALGVDGKPYSDRLTDEDRERAFRSAVELARSGLAKFYLLDEGVLDEIDRELEAVLLDLEALREGYRTVRAAYEEALEKVKAHMSRLLGAGP
jgi:hypothetical protein